MSTIVCGQQHYQMKLKIFEKDLSDKNDVKLIVFIADINSDHPKNDIDRAIAKYTKDRGYIDFVDSHLDNPWIRVVIVDFNNLSFGEKDI